MVTVVVDTREQKPWDFADSETATLETGDYTVEGVSGAIERKSASDFLSSITHDRERFEAECERAESFEKPMVVLVEERWETFESGQYRQNVHPNAVAGTVEAWEERYNIRFVFEENRQTAKERAKSILKRWKGGNISRFIECS
ncbi:hypothetical protein I7X12_10605 [Halosimplex litoreum]|uniref:ERCC4 domain-containing protein n=1 Tax=Halosimplex litoreum TaxID=1198301 RepID=A0A7T3KTP7_9EURY|nr:ERCC4 domain-containing protein [Halosimplex litoreum]QPV61224.1 hypothetical protein I7X12_10605 [Halosimplex litoreum]